MSSGAMSTVLLFFGMIAFVGGIVAIIEAQTPPARYLAVLLTLAGVILLLLFASSGVFARDDGRYAGSPLKPWFDSLKSGKGPCCSDADGTALSDVDWDTVDGHYRVRIGGQWIDVPDDAVIKEPNRAGRTMVWPIYANGMPTIRCFMPGSMI